MADVDNGEGAGNDPSHPRPIQSPAPTVRPWPNSKRQAQRQPEAPEQDLWDAPPRDHLVYPKPWEETKSNDEGCRFENYARAVYKALRHEDQNGGSYEHNEASLADNDVSIQAYFHVSAIEQSLAYWNEILATTSFLQRFLERIEHHAPDVPFSRSCTNQTERLARPQDNSDLGQFLETVGYTIIDQYVSLIGAAACKEGLEHQLRLLFHLGQSRGTDCCQRMVQKILHANNDLDIRHHKEKLRFDPCFLEGIAQGLAQVVHELGRVINIADFGGLESVDFNRFGRLKSFVNLFYKSLESQYPSNINFDGVFVEGLAPDPLLRPRPSALQAVRPHLDSYLGVNTRDRARPTPASMHLVDFGFVRTYVNTHAPALLPLLDPITGQFSYDVACEVDTPVLTRLYHHFEDEVLDYMHVYNSKVECLLVKAKQIQRQKWAVPVEILEAFDIAILLRQAASYQCRSGGQDLSDGHSIWTQQMIEIRELLHQSAKEAADANGKRVSRSEPLNRQFRDSLSRCWKVNRWSKKPFISVVRDAQANTARQFGKCLHKDQSKHDFAYSSVLRSLHRKLLTGSKIPQCFKPSLQKLRWIFPNVPYPVQTKLLSHEAPGTLVLIRYNKNDILYDWQNFEYEAEGWLESDPLPSFATDSSRSSSISSRSTPTSFTSDVASEASVPSAGW